MKKKNIIILSIITVVIILISIILLIVYLINNTTVFKSIEEIQSDLQLIQDEKNSENTDRIINSDTNINNPIYSNDVGVSNGTLYIKEDAEDKIKEAAKNIDIAYEKTVKSEDGFLMIDAYENTNAIDCKVISNTADTIILTAYSSQNLCNYFYTIGDIKDHKQIEEGNDNLDKIRVAKNKTYTISNSIFMGTNTIFLFDKDGKFISSTNENTFTTTEETKYIKVITEEELQIGTLVSYCLVLGTEPNYIFNTNKTDVGIDVNNPEKIYFPIESDNLIIYVDGGEIELKYVAKGV